MCVCVCVCVSLGIYLRLSICVSVGLSICLSVRLSACLLICLSVYMYVCMYVCMYVETIDRLMNQSIYQRYTQPCCIYLPICRGHSVLVRTLYIKDYLHNGFIVYQYT